MKFNNHRKKLYTIFLFGFIILFAILVTNDLKEYYNNNKIKSTVNDNNNDLRTSTIWTPNYIHIQNNWSATQSSYDWCDGAGSWSNPYVIMDVEIDGTNSRTCIFIENTNEYFIIKNCKAYNSIENGGGIKLVNVNNGMLINNNFSNNNGVGIVLYNGENNTISNNKLHKNLNGLYLENINESTISGNAASYSNGKGIWLTNGLNNTISENIVNNNYIGIQLQNINLTDVSKNNINNSRIGIKILEGHYNNIFENSINSNFYGIYLETSTHNKISHNTLIGNLYCIKETEDCDYNVFVDNYCEDYPAHFIPGHLIILIIIVSLLVLLVLIKNRTKKKSR